MLAGGENGPDSIKTWVGDRAHGEAPNFVGVIGGFLGEMASLEIASEGFVYAVYGGGVRLEAHLFFEAV